MKGLAAEHLLQDVDRVPVLGLPGVHLKLLHVVPVLQGQADLSRRPEEEDGSGERLRLQRGAVGTVLDLLGRSVQLGPVQAVQQVQAPHSDLEAERGQEETVGLV